MTLSFALLCVFLVSRSIANPSGHDLKSELQRLKLLRAQYAPHFQDYQLPVPEGDTADSYYPSFFPQYQKLPEIRQKESDADQYYLPYLQPEFKESNPSYTSSRLQETSLKKEEADQYYLPYFGGEYGNSDTVYSSPELKLSILKEEEAGQYYHSFFHQYPKLPEIHQKESDADQYYLPHLQPEFKDSNPSYISPRLQETNLKEEEADQYYLPYLGGEYGNSDTVYSSPERKLSILKEEEADKYYLSYTNAGHKDEDAYNISPIPQPENQKEEDVDKYYAHQLGEDPQDKSSRLHATNQREEDADKYYLPYPTAVQKMTTNMEDIDERENMILDIPKHLLKTKPFIF